MASNEQSESGQDNFLEELMGYVKEELAKPSPGSPEAQDAAAAPTPQDS